MPTHTRSFPLLLLLCLAAALFAAPARAAVFQYALDWEYQRKDETQTGTAYLWIPPDAEHVNGVIMVGLTSMEREFVKDPAIRDACREENLALLYLNTGLSAADVQSLLDRFAQTSGYEELKYAPLMFAGHSAGGPQTQALAKEYAQRCFGLLQHRGGLSGGVPSEVPALATVGQFDEFGGLMRDPETGREGPWEGARDGTAQFRAADPDKLASIAVSIGAGHFAWSKHEADYVSLWIRKAAEARIPIEWWKDATAPVECTDIKPESGWLTDLNLRDPQHEPAPYAQYQGDKANAAWHFDQEMAKATTAFHARGFDGKDQFLDWEDRYWVDAGTRHFFMDINWVDDGQTFEVHPGYRDTYPKQHNGQGPRWPKAGQPVGISGDAIKVRNVSGPIVPVGDGSELKLRMQYDALNPAGERARPTFLAYSPGNKEYRPTEVVGMLPRGFTGIADGAQQTITFPPLENIKADADAVELEATSTSELPVDYYVDYGPAEIVDGKLTITELPASAAYPVEVKVTAYQFGRGIAPKVKTAEPVSQTFQITR